MTEANALSRDDHLTGVDPKQAFRLDAHPLTMYHLLDRDEFNDIEEGWLWWDPDTLWFEIEKVFGIAPSPAARETISALKACIVTRAPWNDAWIFSNVAVALAGGVADLERLQRPTAGQIIFALGVMRRVDDDEPFDESVVRFQAACCQDQGLIYVGDVIAGSDVFLAELNEADERERARTTHQALLSAPDDTDVDDDDAGQVAGAKLYVAQRWAKGLDQQRIFDNYE